MGGEGIINCYGAMDGESQIKSSPENPSLEELVKLYGDYLFRQAYFRIGRREVAEDLVQETFLAAMQNLKNFEGRSSVKTWLLSILKNKSIDYLRKHRREEPVSFSEEPEEEGTRDFFSNGSWRKFLKNWQPSPEDDFEKKKFFQALEKCMNSLPARIRQIFMLKVLDGMDSKTICKELGISASNIWVTIYRARMQLRGCLESSWYNPKRG
jgi:RNA polymerase sigma-70 factor, ECF subfamily